MGKHFLWDPIEDNIVKEIDDSGSTIADYTTEPYLYGDLISQHRDGQSSFYHYDGQGSTSLTDSAANITDTYAYSAFGEVTEQLGSTVSSYKYVAQKGYYSDYANDKYLVRERVCESRTGRWLSVDVLGVLEDINLYRYVENWPILLSDPSGLSCTVCKWNILKGPDNLEFLDKSVAGAIHLGMGLSMITTRNKYLKNAGFIMQHRTQPPLSSGRYQTGEYARPSASYDNCWMYFVEADVCDNPPGSCLVAFKESPWREETNGPDVPYKSVTVPPNAKVSDYKDRKPSDWPPTGADAKAPFIVDLITPYGSGKNKCNRRIVWVDFTCDFSFIKHKKFGTLFAKKGSNPTVAKVYDVDKHCGQLKYQFTAEVQRVPPYVVLFDIKTLSSSVDKCD